MKKVCKQLTQAQLQLPEKNSKEISAHFLPPSSKTKSFMAQPEPS